jgi:hypothetical protein
VTPAPVARPEIVETEPIQQCDGGNWRRGEGVV